VPKNEYKKLHNKPKGSLGVWDITGLALETSQQASPWT